MDINIPDGDDAHLIFLPLPEDVEPEVEDWFVTEVVELARPSSVQFLKDLTHMPQDIAQKVKKHKLRSKIIVNVEEEESQTVAKNQALTYFRPSIIKHLSKSSTKGWNAHRGNYRFCLSARGAGDVRIIFDTIRVSEYSDKVERKNIVKKEHLTPLERALDESAALAKDVIDEMHYMEKREVRMKKTADGTNSRIRYFSYISMIVLLGTTYVQLRYMKGYFKKKKIL